MISVELDRVTSRKSQAQKLESRSSQELEEIARGHQRKYGSMKVTDVDLFMNPEHPMFSYWGALDVLRERHGQDYVSRITGLRGPQGAFERAYNFLTGKLFPVEVGHQFLMYE